jgi:uncharacterized protein YdeI (YjbR/CyaY-like superfamily)
MSRTLADSAPDLPIIACASSAEWEAWLSVHAATSKGVWLKLAKAASGIVSVSKQEAIDGAICHGWIDGQLARYDADFWLVRFTPRQPTSKWSQMNRERALALIETGRMKPEGLREIERARLDGRWDAAYAPQSRATIPGDLQAALDGNEAAKRRFGELDSRNRYAILYRVQDAKKPETRARRIEKYVVMLERGEAIYPAK